MKIHFRVTLAHMARFAPTAPGPRAGHERLNKLEILRVEGKVTIISPTLCAVFTAELYLHSLDFLVYASGPLPTAHCPRIEKSNVFYRAFDVQILAK